DHRGAQALRMLDMQREVLLERRFVRPGGKGRLRGDRGDLDAELRAGRGEVGDVPLGHGDLGDLDDLEAGLAHSLQDGQHPLVPDVVLQHHELDSDPGHGTSCGRWSVGVGADGQAAPRGCETRRGDAGRAVHASEPCSDAAGLASDCRMARRSPGADGRACRGPTGRRGALQMVPPRPGHAGGTVNRCAGHMRTAYGGKMTGLPRVAPSPPPADLPVDLRRIELLCARLRPEEGVELERIQWSFARTARAEGWDNALWPVGTLSGRQLVLRVARRESTRALLGREVTVLRR